MLCGKKLRKSCKILAINIFGSISSEFKDANRKKITELLVQIIKFYCQNKTQAPSNKTQSFIYHYCHHLTVYDCLFFGFQVFVSVFSPPCVSVLSTIMCDVRCNVRSKPSTVSMWHTLWIALYTRSYWVPNLGLVWLCYSPLNKSKWLPTLLCMNFSHFEKVKKLFGAGHSLTCTSVLIKSGGYFSQCSTAQ